MLSGWSPTDSAVLPDLSSLSGSERASAAAFQTALFATSCVFTDRALNLDARVRNVLTASIILYYGSMKHINRSSPYISRIANTLASVGAHETELTNWAFTIKTSMTPASAAQGSASPQSGVEALLKEQASFISDLVRESKNTRTELQSVSTRLASIEAAVGVRRDADAVEAPGCESSPSTAEQSESETSAPPKRCKHSSMSLATAWYEHHTSDHEQ